MVYGFTFHKIGCHVLSESSPVSGTGLLTFRLSPRSFCKQVQSQTSDPEASSDVLIPYLVHFMKQTSEAGNNEGSTHLAVCPKAAFKIVR